MLTYASMRSITNDNVDWKPGLWSWSQSLDPGPKQFWMVGAWAKNFLDGGARSLKIWVPVQASYTNNTCFFCFFGPNCSGAGTSQDVGGRAKKVRCPEPEPEVWVPAPLPCWKPRCSSSLWILLREVTFTTTTPLSWNGWLYFTTSASKLVSGFCFGSFWKRGTLIG